MQLQTVSKSQFKPKALEYLRMVEITKKPLMITHKGKPAVKVIPANEKQDKILFDNLKGTVIKYIDPLEPVGLEDWEVLK